MTKDWRLTRREARRLVMQEDALRRERMPIFRIRPPMTEVEIEDLLPEASARHAFWRDGHSLRPIDEAIAGASPGQIVAYCVPYSYADICNGGFHQFFGNYGGAFASITIDALRRIGEDERAALMKRAMGRFSIGQAPKTPGECRAALTKIDFRSDWLPWIEPIERAYYSLSEADLTRGVRDYVASHPQELFIDEE